MTKKNKSVFKAIVAVLVSLFCFSAIVALFRGNPQTETQKDSATGDVTIDVNGVYEIAVSNTSSTELGEENEKIVFTGSTDGATIRAIGNGNGVIKAATGGELVFKNLVIEDKTTDTNTVLYVTYLRFGGQLRFENCTFTDSIYLMNDANATFENCTFRSTRASCYSVWLADGSASFEKCTFTGYRGFKTHEFTYGKVEDGDVENVTINNCTFLELTEKVGVVLGKFETNPTNTVIRITNSEFINCQSWDATGSIEGVDGIYESDTFTSEFDFVQENNTVRSTEDNETESVVWTGYY